MMPALAADDRASLLASLSLHGFLRRPAAGRGGHREWLHFCVRGDDLDLVVNLNIVDDPRVPRGERIRLLVFARRGREWLGDLSEHDPELADLRGGQLRAHVQGTVIELVGDHLELRGASRDRRIAFELVLSPRSFPSIAREVAIPGGAPLSWLVVPRLAASGSIVLDGHAQQLHEAPAYHDHNWGHFTHRDFAWQWGHAHGERVSVVVSRLLDRGQSTSFLQTLMLWRGPRLARIFRGDQLRLRPRGFARPGRTLVLPRLAALLASGASEVPSELAIEARADGDVLEGTFTTADLARIVVPELEDLRTTIIHEVVGRLALRGVVHGEEVEVDAPAMFELLRRAR